MRDGQNASTNQNLPPMAERRPILRRTVLLQAEAMHPLIRYAIPCQIRNLSERGARIAISSHHYLPPELTLVILRDGSTFQAGLVWRSGERAGFVFKANSDIHCEP
jgi:hypothetical protein